MVRKTGPPSRPPKPPKRPYLLIPIPDDTDEDQPPPAKRANKKPEAPTLAKTEEERKYWATLPTTKQKELWDAVNEMGSKPSTIPLRFQILTRSCPSYAKTLALQKLEVYGKMSSSDSEWGKLKQWLDAFVHLPWGNYVRLPVSLADGTERCQAFLNESATLLEKEVFGMKEAKTKFLEVLAQWITCPNSVGQILALQGPPGVGKTHFVKNGVARILGRPFFFIPLGGTQDGSFFRGHDYTYVGSVWGKIVDVLLQAHCMNPILYFDELDKVSTTDRGVEIANILTHMTDKTQNDKFHDRYFESVDFNISQCLFIFSYNDDSLIHPILKDRLTVLNVGGYSSKEKKAMAQQYLIPKLLEQYGFGAGDILFPPEVLDKLVEGSGESGVRDLLRSLETLISTLNYDRVCARKTFPLTLSIEALAPPRKSKLSVEVQRMYV